MLIVTFGLAFRVDAASSRTAASPGRILDLLKSKCTPRSTSFCLTRGGGGGGGGGGSGGGGGGGGGGGWIRGSQREGASHVPIPPPPIPEAPIAVPLSSFNSLSPLRPPALGMPSPIPAPAAPPRIAPPIAQPSQRRGCCMFAQPETIKRTTAAAALIQFFHLITGNHP